MLETAIDRLAMRHEASPNVFTMQVAAESNGISMAHQKFSPLGRSAGGVLHFHRCLVTKQNMLDRLSLKWDVYAPGVNAVDYTPGRGHSQRDGPA
jgi:hypothetical protein